jgi:ABC-type glycerol-3-phosphate transport system substrate-binding protein
MRPRLDALTLVALLLLAGCAAHMAPADPDTSEPVTSIYVIRHGWHSGIALAPRRYSARPLA